jgi:hypothetical protein
MPMAARLANIAQLTTRLGEIVSTLTKYRSARHLPR